MFANLIGLPSVYKLIVINRTRKSNSLTLTNPLITCFLLKIASRCNLNCDYCYVYNHNDQSWKNQPAFMSTKTILSIAERICEYTTTHDIKRILVVLHGGEPLLAGQKRISNIVNTIRKNVPKSTQIDFSIQTNGTLLTDEIIKNFEKLNIGISLSLDGNKKINDLHRLDHKGKSSHEQVEGALVRLTQNPGVFSGIIAVIDPNSDPVELLEYFNRFNPPILDFLLPDANHESLPPGREKNDDLYTSWLIRCFDTWFDSYPHLRIRFFDQLLNSIVGLPSETDAFGLGDISLLCIETDGYYHDLDVLKITENDATNLYSGGVSDVSVDEVLRSSKIAIHRNLLSVKGLSQKCQECKFLEICGGGSVPHRYSKNGFKNPTVYCDEIYKLIEHAGYRLNRELKKECSIQNKYRESGKSIEYDVLQFENEKKSRKILSTIKSDISKQSLSSLYEAFDVTLRYNPEKSKIINDIKSLSRWKLNKIALLPSIVLWAKIILDSELGKITRSIDGNSLKPDYEYVDRIYMISQSKLAFPLIHRNDPWLRLPFGKKIYFEESDIKLKFLPLFKESIQLIKEWNIDLYNEISSISPEIQFIRDLEAHPDKIVSFSDNSVPGALYVSILQNNNFVSPFDLADSIIHEHRHQKLYLLQNKVTLIESDFPLIDSPWRDDKRPPSGLMHALFVFTKLLSYWKYIQENYSGNIKERASFEISTNNKRLETGFRTIRNTKLTKIGHDLISALETSLEPENK